MAGSVSGLVTGFCVSGAEPSGCNTRFSRLVTYKKWNSTKRNHEISL
jgi:hypothetical protein